MQSDKFLRMLGLAQRAGGVAFGEGAVRDSIRGNTAKLVIVAKDAADNTKKKFGDNCSFYGIRHAELFDRYTLGKACGREFAVVLSVKNEGLAQNLITMLDTDTL